MLSDRTRIDVYDDAMLRFVLRVRSGDRIQYCLTDSTAASDPPQTHFAVVDNLSNGDQAETKV